MRARSRTPAPRRRRPKRVVPEPVEPVVAVVEPVVEPVVAVAKPVSRSLASRVLLPVVTYGASALVHGAVVHLHGTSCGVSLFDFHNWHKALFTVGSTWCRGLAVVVHGTTLLNEHSAVHLLSLLF
jgi:hypothetical protein